jgi:hypothetical protein
MATQIPRYRYRVDTSDVIVWVDPLWLAFAKENGAIDLTEEAVVGRSLWDFVAGAETQQLFLGLHERIRSTGKTMVLPFRCDSPSLQRHMRLTITREEHGRLHYDSLLVRAVPQRPLGLLEKSRPRSHETLMMCSCCKRALLERVGWLDLEDISVRLHLFEAEEVPALRHTVCPTCAKSLDMLDIPSDGNAA